MARHCSQGTRTTMLLRTERHDFFLISVGIIFPAEIYAASCSTSCLAALSASALSASSPIGGEPTYSLSVNSSCFVIPSPSHPQRSSLPPSPSPLVSAAQNVPLPCLSWKDSLSLLLGYSRPGAARRTRGAMGFACAIRDWFVKATRRWLVMATRWV
jgi:hypothetical protein